MSKQKQPLLSAICWDIDVSLDHLFPDKIRKAIKADEELLVSDLRTALPACIHLHEFNRAFTLYMGQLRSLLSNRHILPQEDIIFFARLFLDFLDSDLCAYETLNGPKFSVQSEVVQLTSVLLSQIEPYGIEVEWKPLYKLLLTYHFRHHSYSSEFILPATAARNGASRALSRTERKMHLQRVVSLIRRARPFFSVEAAGEIMATIHQSSSPHDISGVFGTSLMCLFVPTNYPETISAWAGRVVDELKQSDGSASVHDLLNLLGRAARDSLGVVNWSPYVKDIFNVYMRTLPLPSKPRRQCENISSKLPLNSSATESAALFMAYTITEECSASLSVLSHFLHTFHNFAHPTNTGSTRSVISLFCGLIGSKLGERYGYQHRGLLRHASPATELSPTLRRQIVEVLYPTMFKVRLCVM